MTENPRVFRTKRGTTGATKSVLDGHLPRRVRRPHSLVPRMRHSKISVAVAGIGALARFGPAVGLALLAGVLIIRIALVLRPLAFALVGIIGDVVAAFRLAGMILGQGDREREQRG